MSLNCAAVTETRSFPQRIVVVCQTSLQETATRGSKTGSTDTTKDVVDVRNSERDRKSQRQTYISELFIALR